MKATLIRFASIITAVLFMCYGTAAAAASLSEKDWDALYRTSVWYDDSPVTGCGTGTSSVGGLIGSGNEEQIFNYFTKQRGLPAYVAAAFMGNMNSESGLDPTALEPGGHGDAPIAGRGFGLVQWTFPSRQDPLVQRAQAAGKPPTDLLVQLDYVWYEITDGPAPYNQVGPGLKSQTDVVSATQYIETTYEVHAGGIQPKRTADAQMYLQKYGNGADNSGAAPAAGTASSSGGCSSAGAAAADADGYVFPLKTTQSAMKSHQPTWCWQSQTNCHHDYPAADLFTDEGTEVVAARGGKVVVAEEKQCDGQLGGSSNITVQGDDGKWIFYTHMQGALGAHVGDTVTAGQSLGHVGPASCAENTTPHVHVQWYTSMITGNSTSMEIQPMLTKAFAALPP